MPGRIIVRVIYLLAFLKFDEGIRYNKIGLTEPAPSGSNKKLSGNTTCLHRKRFSEKLREMRHSENVRCVPSILFD